MRKHLCLLAVLVVTLAGTATAQTEKGDWMVGGNFALNTTKNNSAFNLSPSAGYFFARNFVAGGLFNFAYSKSGDTKTTAYSAGPFARYYFGNSNLKPMVVGEFQFGTNSTRVSTNKTTDNFNSLLLGGGLAAFVNQHVAIETIAGYGRTKLAGYDGSGGFVFKVGFQVYLSPRGMLDTYRKKE
ncbi:MAG TPA: outer membrane beta-barrel protein [Flavihumibacter sp.]|nr:outer membrane beta-barrel protein [Bacteroidota bacterium]HOA37083.1 outer membrane beta-barrel protein [Flavihumibacter sp.]HPZ87670.1 outer membrane beta-barrel protein [Flavihumibacter sp.]HQD09945.1 outer membrane beta-barrel protein [Flavihumibacter sp.]